MLRRYPIALGAVATVGVPVTGLGELARRAAAGPGSATGGAPLLGERFGRAPGPVLESSWCAPGTVVRWFCLPRTLDR